jgi:hypothetical protein
LQRGRRASIIELDNRAREIWRDFDYPTVPRDASGELEAMIVRPLSMSASLSMREIGA